MFLHDEGSCQAGIMAMGGGSNDSDRWLGANLAPRMKAKRNSRDPSHSARDDLA